MKRLVLFVVALVFAFCTIAIAEGPATAPAAATTEKAAPVKAEKVQKAPSTAQLAQQEKMKTCNKEASAKALKGDERKAFMKTCLSGKTSTTPATATAATKVTQQDKMKACNKDAKEKALKGDERKKFMSECLKK